MAYYYVKSGGTAGATTDAGRYASQQTGSFATLGAANYYASIVDAFNSGKPNPPVSGDFICISDASALSTATALAIANAPTGTGPGARVICVSDTNCDQAAVASSALEYITGGASDVKPNDTTDGKMVYYGVYLKSDDDVFLGRHASNTVCVKCSFEATGTGDIISVGEGGGQYGAMVTFVDCPLIFGHTNAAFALRGGVQFKMFGGSVTGKTDLFDSSLANAGGAVAYLSGVDLSAITDSVINDDATGSGDGGLDLTLIRCRMASGVEFVDSVGGVIGWGQRIQVYNSAHDSSAEYQYYAREEQCVAQETTSFYRDNSVGYPSGQKVSIKVTTSANASISRPFWFDLPTTYADLTSSSSDLIRYFLLSSASLTDADIWMVATYPDGTNIYVPNREVSSTLTDIAAAFNPFRTGTGLTTNTESWTGRTTENRYQIDLDTSADPGAKCVPIVRCYVAKASATIYICATPELS